MSTDAFTNIIKALKEVAQVPVYLDMRDSTVHGTDTNSIVISRVKMLDLLSSYEFVYTCVHKAWSNLPEPPTNEKVHIFMWMLAAENYCVNNYTITGEGANSNTFVHMWAIVDRMRNSFEAAKLSWLIGPRNCVGYSEVMGLNGAMDTNMYFKEPVTPRPVLDAMKQSVTFEREDMGVEFSSYYDMHVSMMVPKKQEVVNIAAMIARRR